MVLPCGQRGPRLWHARKRCSAGFVAPGFAYQRPAVLALLGHQQRTADEVAEGLAELGLGPPMTAKVRFILRAMEQEDLVRFCWSAASPGRSSTPMYAATDRGHAYLRQLAPSLIDYRDALGRLLDRYQVAGVDRGYPNR